MSGAISKSSSTMSRVITRTSMNKTHFVSIVALAASAALSQQALADGAAPTKAASEAKPTVASIYDRLPEGELKVPTKLTLPAAIAKTETLEGVYVEIPDYIKKNPQQGTKYVQVFASAEDAKARNTGQPAAATECFMSAQPSFNNDDQIRWNGSQATSVTVQPYPKSYNYGAYGASPKDMNNVQAVRVDRIADESPEKVTLESRVVLIDAVTLGVRLSSQSKTDFAFIKELPGRVKIYGARSKDQMTFLVRRQKHPQERFAMGAMFVQQGTTGEGSASASDDCHLTFNMPVKQAKAATAVLQLEAILDIKDPTSDDDSVKANPVALPGTREGHIRTLEVGFSSTWMSQDKAPVVSLTHGWLGRERTQNM